MVSRATLVAKYLGVSTKCHYKWTQEDDLQKQPAVSRDVFTLKQEVAMLNATLKRAIEERDILKKDVYFASHYRKSINVY